MMSDESWIFVPEKSSFAPSFPLLEPHSPQRPGDFSIRNLPYGEWVCPQCAVVPIGHLVKSVCVSVTSHV